MKNDRSYLLKRESEERAAATQARGKARAAHEEMARLYRDRAGTAEGEKTRQESAGTPAQAG